MCGVGVCMCVCVRVCVCVCERERESVCVCRTFCSRFLMLIQIVFSASLARYIICAEVYVYCVKRFALSQYRVIKNS